MPRRRDRHGRGIRGPLAGPNRFTGRPVPLSRPNRVAFFNSCVTAAMADIADAAPDALNGIVVGVEEVPHLNVAWSGDRVPLSAALEPSRGRKAQIVLFQRPLEHRAMSRRDLSDLVHQTIVEQLSALTGRSIEDLGGDPGWDD
ncbi:MAG: metallopeptidase family protein [Tessaracoccus sp.]|uniref:metallopeptidase family protein n=1 Tax=Tessaracoccus sp. TaxID=1971211 RepID=UPI001EC95064|nr:metallopeptidase family protein [Tessaracoccus sp.]MBK7821626.1 metallopeptidase family protein [Tessaracoccus sp.]